MKKTKTKKYNLGGIIGAGANVLSGVGTSIYGAVQRKRAQKEIDALKKNAVKAYVPPALRGLAQEPVSEKLMEAQEDSAARRTADSLGALSRGGARSVLGGVNSVLDAERGAERLRMGEYEQARKRAISDLASAEQRVNDSDIQMWQNDMDAARGEKLAGQQNIVSGLSSIGKGAIGLGTEFDDDGTGSKKEKKKETNENGGVLEGEFSHETNPIDLVKDGEKIGEATGQEVILNPSQRKAIEKQSPYAKKLFAKFFKELNEKKLNKKKK